MVEKWRKMYGGKKYMTYQELVSEIRDIFMQADVSGIKEHIAYQFDIRGEAEGAFYAEVSEGKLYIEPYEYYDRDVLFTTTADTLLSIAGGTMDAIAAFTQGKLQVEGSFDKALLLQNFSKQANREKKKQKKAEEKNLKTEIKQAKAEKTAEKKTAEKKAASGPDTAVSVKTDDIILPKANTVKNPVKRLLKNK